jgi:hypothetical protein
MRDSLGFLASLSTMWSQTATGLNDSEDACRLQARAFQRRRAFSISWPKEGSRVAGANSANKMRLSSSANHCRATAGY